ncbi:alpha/beta hydrolase [Methylobacillus arboreus]|uniref:RBBP9/YdeN family alpha/beta hydrolase n=1 Tax=Methylobacillus arboreus TaxID=755170 RepID=UPI001E521517|nr:alpha/beta hydrolase [Methylobacillus arboreus]MCB5191703.1 alpha/beta hydrolase [Methylobacillus arboreus]
MQKNAVYIIHGYQASPQSHWFPWVKQALESQDFKVDVLALPESSTPDLGVWLDHLRANITGQDQHTYFIGHSLGCITLLRYLEEQQQPAGGMILVSGFAEPLSFLPALDVFTAVPLDSEHIIRLVPKRIVMAAQDDNIVPYPYSLRLAEKLRAEWELFEKGGHFMAQDGFSEFPALYDAIIGMRE